YLDVISEVRAASDLPLVAYSVSGEYAMLKAAAAAGVLEEGPAVREALLAMRRAGADPTISYHATEAPADGWPAWHGRPRQRPAPAVAAGGVRRHHRLPRRPGGVVAVVPERLHRLGDERDRGRLA